MRVILSKSFEHEFKEIYYSPRYVNFKLKDDFYKEFFQKIKYIKIFPEMYPRFIKNPRYRKIPIKQYIILYEIKKDRIILRRIIHQKSKKLNFQD